MAALAGAIRARGLNHVVIAARGTSDNAGRYAQYVLGALNGLTVTLATPSLFSIYERPPDLRGALVLGISQSGQSPDIVAVLAEARRQGCLTAALTNEPASPLAATADHLIDLGAGAEKAVALARVWRGDGAEMPASLIQPHDGQLTWLVDAAAASQINNDSSEKSLNHQLVEA